ncbi:MAG: hypothetical protein ACI83O_000240 [Patescibacteria group bacterium]|jgi:hypothetical protein
MGFFNFFTDKQESVSTPNFSYSSSYLTEDARNFTFMGTRPYSLEECLRQRETVFPDHVVRKIAAEFSMTDRMLYFEGKNHVIDSKKSRHAVVTSGINSILDSDDRYQESEREADRVYKSRITSLLHSSHKAGVEDYISKNVEAVPQLHSIKITQEAMDKANLIAKRMVNASKTPDEIYFHMLSGKDDTDFVIRDIYIPRQAVTPSLCSTDHQYYGMDDFEIEKSGYKNIAWGHSHGHHDVFFSGTDHTNINANNDLYPSFTLPFDSYSGKNINVHAMPCLVFNALNASPAKRIGVAYTSLFGDLFERYDNKTPNLDIISESNGIDMTIDSIDKMIYNRVTTPRGFKNSFEENMFEKYGEIIRGDSGAYSEKVRIQRENDVEYKANLSRLFGQKVVNRVVPLSESETPAEDITPAPTQNEFGVDTFFSSNYIVNNSGYRHSVDSNGNIDLSDVDMGSDKVQVRGYSYDNLETFSVDTNNDPYMQNRFMGYDAPFIHDIDFENMATEGTSETNAIDDYFVSRSEYNALQDRHDVLREEVDGLGDRLGSLKKSVKYLGGLYNKWRDKD